MIRRRSMLRLLPLSFATGCAWISYPERRWQENPGPIEVVPLVVDCLLFIPGLVPGIIALAVDFGTRAIYVPRSQVRGVTPGKVVSLGDRVPERAELRVLDVDARERARSLHAIDPGLERQPLRLDLPSREAFTMDLLLDGRLAASAQITA